MHERLLRCPAAALAAVILISAAGDGRAEAGEAVAAGMGTPAAAWEDFREGERLSREGDLKGALAAFTGARTALAAGDPFDRSLAEALALDLYNLAASFTASGDAEPSLRCFEQIFLLRRKAGALRDAAFESAVRTGSETIADYAVSIGKAEIALPVYRARLEMDPADGATRLKLGAALLAMGKFDAVRKEAQEIRRFDPRSADSWALTARTDFAESAKLKAGSAHREARLRYEWGLADLDESLKLDRDNLSRLREYAAASAILADLLDEEGDVAGSDAARDRSLQAFDEALRATPGEGTLRLERARLLRRSDRLPEAAVEMDRAIEALERRGSAETLRAAREALAECLLLQAADALNEGRFADAGSELSRARSLDPRRIADAEALAKRIEERRARFDLILQENEKALAANPRRGDCHLALSDLHFTYGRYDEAWRELQRAAGAEENRPPDDVLRQRASRARSGSPEPARKMEIEVEGGRVSLLYASEDGLAEVRKSLPEVWRKLASLLGPLPAGEIPLIKLYGNQRAFLTSGLPRLGITATGARHRGVAAVYQEPGRGTPAWRAVLAREIGRWAVDRLTRGRAPRWVAEGVSRWVASDGKRTDHGELAAAAAAGKWVTLGSIDAAFAAAWNDPESLPLLLDESQALVEALSDAKGAAAVRAFLLAMAAASGPGVDQALAAGAGISASALERIVLASLATPPPASKS